MIYAKWKLDFTDDPQYGVGPDTLVAERGDSIEGAFFVGDAQDWIYGYLNEGFNMEGLEQWNITEVTQEDILAAALQLNPDCYVNDHGRIASPLPEPA